MFATVAVVGIQTLTRVNFKDDRNIVIVATSLALAMLVTVQPNIAKVVPGWAEIIFGSGSTLGSLCAILLNLIFHHSGGPKHTTNRRPSHRKPSGMVAMPAGYGNVSRTPRRASRPVGKVAVTWHLRPRNRSFQASVGDRASPSAAT